VLWRIRPPSVAIRGAEAVIAHAQALGLAKFVRTKEEVNKEAILNEPDQVRGVAGIIDRQRRRGLRDHAVRSGDGEGVKNPLQARKCVMGYSGADLRCVKGSFFVRPSGTCKEFEAPAKVAIGPTDV
jgi:hypothetical protein